MYRTFCAVSRENTAQSSRIREYLRKHHVIQPDKTRNCEQAVSKHSLAGPSPHEIVEAADARVPGGREIQSQLHLKGAGQRGGLRSGARTQLVPSAAWR